MVSNPKLKAICKKSLIELTHEFKDVIEPLPSNENLIEDTQKPKLSRQDTPIWDEEKK